LPHRTRFSIVNAIFNDAAKHQVPHQWEKKDGFECGPNNDCSVANPNQDCRRDTSTKVCISG
jgi:hypothetical protein